MIRASRAGLALLIVAMAVIGAALHPLAFLLGVLPLHLAGLRTALDGLKSLIFDLLAWGVVSLLLVMGIMVVRGRLTMRGAGRSADDGSDEIWVRPKSHRVAIAITAYNDAHATALAVRAFKRQDGVAEVIVIDNNCQDDTVVRARGEGALVVRERRQGYGYACIRGLSEALTVPEADVIVLTEGDGTFVATDLPKFLAYIDQADMVVGNRVVRGLVERGSQMDYFFTWGNIAVAMLLRLRFWDSQFLGAAPLSDVGCTYRAIRREALQRILPELAVGGYHFSPHMVLVALNRHLSVVEIPVTFRKRIGVSKGASRSFSMGFLVGLTMIWHILTYRPQPAALAPKPLEPALEVVNS